MRAPGILSLVLMASGCAATSESAPAPAEALHMLERVDAWSIDASGPAVPRTGRDTSATSVLDTTATSPESESPHSFNGGVGVRVRDGEAALNLVAEYHYRVSPALDIGGIADWAGSPIDSLLIAPAAWLHPDDHLTLFGAPGVEFISGRGGKGAVRVGGSYLIPFGRLAIRPFGWYDFVKDRENSFSLGVALGV